MHICLFCRKYLLFFYISFCLETFQTLSYAVFPPFFYFVPLECCVPKSIYKKVCWVFFKPCKLSVTASLLPGLAAKCSDGKLNVPVAIGSGLESGAFIDKFAICMSCLYSLPVIRYLIGCRMLERG